MIVILHFIFNYFFNDCDFTII